MALPRRFEKHNLKLLALSTSQRKELQAPAPVFMLDLPATQYPECSHAVPGVQL